MQDIEEIYNNYAQIVYKYIFCLTKNKELSEDIVQETFLVAVKNIDKFRGKSKISTWLCQIAKFILYKDIRKKEKQKNISLEDVENELITEKLVIDGPFSENIGISVLDKAENDEVVLCLNYDGKFGLNNMNNYFQNANKNKAVTWQEWTYKKGDPILFNDNKRFSVLYNNLKGYIVDIEKIEDEITFTIDIDIILTQKQCEKDDIDFIDIINDKTRIKIKVYRYDDTDEDSETTHIDAIIPFQLAYAVSIHKAQGLEYNSVKIIIPPNNSEKITHGIFYTAITRAKNKLKIFWSSETMQKIIKSFEVDVNKRKSLEIVKSKLIKI